MAATPSKPTEEFVTTNLVLASVLSLAGYESSMLVLDRERGDQDHPQGAWKFDSDMNLQAHVDEFKAGDYLVEPETFYKKVNNVRRELFDFLGISN